MNSRGYTLIEMVVVLAIIGLITAMVVPRLSQPGDQAQPFAVSLTAFLNAASAQAANRETPVCVAVNGTQVTLAPSGETLQIPPGVQLTLTPYCYDLHGRVAAVQAIRMRSESDASLEARVTVEAGYGTARARSGP